MADSTVSTTTDSVVTTMLLVRLTQNSWSGRDNTAPMLSRVGGIGRPAGSAEIRSPRLNTLASTRYSGTKNSALTRIAETGRIQARFTGPPRGVAATSARS